MSKSDYDLLRLPAVCKKTGLSRSTIYLRMRAGDFPEPVSLGPRLIAFRSDEIQAWMDAQPRAADFQDRTKPPAPETRKSFKAKKQRGSKS